MAERWRLASRRRSFAARPGRVGTRGRCGGATASLSRAASRALAPCRLASWLRCSEAATVSTPPASRPASRSLILDRAQSGSTDDRPTSKESSTRLSAVLTDWPPGPDDLEKRSCSSLPGIVSQPFTRRSSGIPWLGQAGDELADGLAAASVERDLHPGVQPCFGAPQVAHQI